ncbi:hypothetical protein ANN_16967 [Periplaneta americana]|uniref:Uncharacterized protein n=1 Tax=Periplaneta americana TaxID=6978 RepID=A0ABQ8SSY6_PERAM|nr:hypothetical protein ANN_16967 [Periplaneta americana]
MKETHCPILPDVRYYTTLPYEKNCAVSSTQKFLVQQHITTSKHQANKQLNSKQRQLFLTQPTTSNVRSEFNIDLCRSLISADIPLYKLKNKVFREFLEKYTQHTIPDESTLRKTYAPSIYDETIQKIRDEIKDSSIWVSIDETPDKEVRKKLTPVRVSKQFTFLTLPELPYVSSRAVASWCTKASWFESSKGKKFSHEISIMEFLRFTSSIKKFVVITEHSNPWMPNCNSYEITECHTTSRGKSFDVIKEVLASVAIFEPKTAANYLIRIVIIPLRNLIKISFRFTRYAQNCKSPDYTDDPALHNTHCVRTGLRNYIASYCTLQHRP